MKQADVWIGGFFSLLGLLVVVEASKMDYGAKYGAGPGFFPFWLGVVIALLGLVLVVQALTVSKEGGGQAAPPNWKRWGLGVAALTVFLLMVGHIGFVSAFSLLLVLPLLLMEGESWRRAILLTALMGGGFYFFFIWLLQVDMPRGPLGF